MDIRLATAQDIPAVNNIYEEIHTAEEAGRVTIGWIRGVYPTRATAEAALQRQDLYVMKDEGEVRGAAIINQAQVDVYADAPWRYPARDEEVLVLHTLVISPRYGGRGYGKAFVAFYEAEARRRSCPYLRMDTNARNQNARRLYARLGYEEIAIVPTEFNHIPGVQLVLLEKRL